MLFVVRLQSSHDTQDTGDTGDTGTEAERSGHGTCTVAAGGGGTAS